MQINDSHSVARFIPNRSVHQMNALQHRRATGQSPSTGRPQALSMARTLLDVQRTATTAPPAAKIPPTGQSLPGGLPEIQKTVSDPLKALLADWGKKDSPWDLNGDGTVGIQDMLQLLAGMSLPKDDPPEPDPLKALLADWGKKDSPYDLNGDGTVGIQDLLQLLAGMSLPKNDPPPAHPDPLVTPPPLTPGDVVNPAQPAGIALDAADTTAPGAVADASPAKTPLQLLLEDWGKTGSRWDLNQNGNVGIRDMLMLLAQMTNTKPSSSGADRLDRDDHRHGRRTRAVAANYHRVAARNIARALAPQMSTMQPGELRESIQGSNLPDLQKRFVLDQIAAWHPHGHSISLVG